MFRRLILSKTPFYCVFCQERDATMRNLCVECAPLLKNPPHRCQVCALPLVAREWILAADRGLGVCRVTDWSFSSSRPSGVSASRFMNVCGQCIQSPPPVNRTVCAMSYCWPATRLIQQLKFGRSLVLARTLGELLGAATTMPDRSCRDVLLPMPLSGLRMRERGFNQSYEIARFVARQTGLTLRTDLLHRNVDRPSQAGMGRLDRKRNVRSVFHASSAVKGLNVVVVDDVMTTGATMYEAARTLKSAGALSVDAWVVARTDRAQRR